MRHNNNLFIIYKSLINFKNMFWLILLAIFNFKLLGIALAALYFIISIAFNFFTRKFTNFYIEDNNLIYNHGFFNKSSINIPLDKITTIDLTQDILLRILSLYKVKVDSGASTIAGSDILVYLKKDDAEELKKELLQNNHSISNSTIDENINYFTISPKKIIMLSISSNFIFVGVGIIFALYNFILEVSESINLNFNNAIDSSMNTIHSNFIANKPLVSIILFATITLIILVITACIFATVGAFLKFYNYKVWKNDNFINIEYGLLSTKKYSLPIDNINTIIIKQSFIRRFLKLYTLEVAIIGYGDEENEQAILYPIGSYKELEFIAHSLLPNYNLDIPLTKAGRNTLLKFMLPAIVSTIIIIILSLFLYGFIYSLSITPLVFLGCFLMYKNAGLGFNESTLLVSNGMFSRLLTFIPFNKIDSVEKCNSYFQKRKNICNYIFTYHSNSILKLVNVNNIDNKFYNIIIEKLEY